MYRALIVPRVARNNMEENINNNGFIPKHGGYQNLITYQKAIENPEPEICANSMICLISIVSYLLAQQIKSLEKAFINEGGIRERMTKARINKRNQNNN